ncbi:MAG: CHAT domain-containing protein, partial [Leptolyngbya sp. SIO4C5]|nr:CHAT domain-containing protein [Leptolyngbya sp. SIO4C5]
EALNAQAIAYFQQSYAIALTQQNTSAQVRSLLGLISAYKLAENPATAQQNWELAQTAVQQLPASQTKAFTLIKLTDLLEPLALRKSQVTPTAATLTQATALLNQAIAIGETIENPRVISFGLGELGNLYERAGRYGTALEKTQQARLAADQELAARESLYLWEWQIGRIYKAQNKLAEAEQAYAQAIALLEQIRSEILNANRDLQFDFRDTVEPIYRQYAELNLSTVPEAVALTQGEPAFADLDAALVTLDSLKVAELQSYFASDCVIVPTQTRADAVGQSTETAVLSTAIAADQLTVILSLPDGSKKTVQAAVSQSALREQINAFRKSLEFGIRDYRFNSQPAQQIYRQLIQPFEADLVNVKTLVFVNDGLLRSVPMAALYDGQQFLIERFAIATTPSLTLTNPEKSNRQSLNALLLGVSEPSEVPQRPFAPLPAVEQELAALSARLPNSEVLLNQDFSIAALQQKLATKDYRILHMATHGSFGFAPEDNFVVVGAKRTGEDSQFNQTLTIGELDQLIRSVSDPTRSPIELLTITACETAIGDNRSTLGLAGVAVRAGVRSAVATLWSVSDESTAELITNFYENLKDPSLTKAEALQRAQVAMLRSDDVVKANPYRWAPFILIGNWL